MSRIAIVLSVLCLLVVAVPGAGAETREELKKKFEKRFKDLQKYKKAGKIGETNVGYVEALDEKYLKDKDLKKLLDAENADRTKLYKIVAKLHPTDDGEVTIEHVGKQNAMLKFKKAGPEEYFKGKDGKWRQKKAMLKEKKKEK